MPDAAPIRPDGPVLRLRLPRGLMGAVHAAAKQRDVSKSAWIRSAIRDALKAQGVSFDAG
jgi:predicted transcriptional regulator